MNRWLKTLSGAALGVSLMGASCFDVTEPLELTVNTSNLAHSFNVQTGAVAFGVPANCTTINPQDYLDSDFDITTVRVTDIQVQTVGTFSGSIQNGALTINGQPVLAFSGPWSTFNTSQSLLTSGAVQVGEAGINALTTAVKNRQQVTICSSGQFSGPAPAGLQVKTTIFGQVDVTP